MLPLLCKMPEDHQLDTPINLNPRRLVRQIAFCDPQIPQYSAVLENNFPASQLRLEVNRGVQLVRMVRRICMILAKRDKICTTGRRQQGV